MRHARLRGGYGPLLEVCVTTARVAARAPAAGAHRIELCARIAAGGLTPGVTTVQRVLQAVPVPVPLTVRPRQGVYVYTRAHRERMLDAIVRVRDLGAEGVVLGVLTAAGTADVAAGRELVDGRAPWP